MGSALRDTQGWVKTAILVLTTAVLLTGVAAYMVVANNVSKNLNREISKLRAAGQPVGYSELDKFYDLGPDAAARGQAYADLFTAIPNEESIDHVLFFSETPDIEETLDSALIADSKQFLDANRPLMGQLHALAQNTAAVRFPGETREWMKGKGFEHLWPLRTAVRLLCLDALLSALDGNGDQAIRSLGDAIVVANVIRDEPFAISQLVRTACLTTSFHTIEQIVNRTKVSDPQLIRFQGQLNAVQIDGMTVHAMVGETSLNFEDDPNSEFWDNLPDELKAPAMLVRLPPYRQLETVNGLHAYEKLAEIGELPPFERLQAITAFRDSIDALPIFGNRGAKLNAGSLSGTYIAENGCMALQGAAQVALAALRFNSLTGSLRGEAKELVSAFLKEVPIDPFSGEPILLRGKASGFVAYSFGPDGDDDRGTTPSEMGNINRDGDVTFRVLSLPER